MEGRQQWTSDRVVPDLMLPLWEDILWPFLDAWDSVRLRKNRHAMECPREIRAVLFHLVQKKPAFLPDSEAFNYFIGDGFLIPELTGGSEASEDDQADNVCNEALYVIGLHGSGDTISCYLQDWEVAKVALSCRKALDMLCQVFYEVERRCGWFGF